MRSFGYEFINCEQIDHIFFEVGSGCFVLGLDGDSHRVGRLLDVHLHAVESFIPVVLGVEVELQSISLLLL